jgi:hypothetical protein
VGGAIEVVSGSIRSTPPLLYGGVLRLATP